jgi:hypothetical protein
MKLPDDRFWNIGRIGASLCVALVFFTILVTLIVLVRLGALRLG